MSFFEIGKIKIKIPKVRAPKAPAGRAMPKPRAARKPAGEKIGGFSLTIFSSNRGPKGIKKIEVIRELLASGGNRTAAAQRLGVTGGVVSQHAKKIRRLSDADLQKYATQLKTTVDEIKRVCADFSAQKGITHIDLIRALLASNGNRRGAAKKLGVNYGNVSDRAKGVRRLSDAQLQEYAGKLNTTVDEIKRVCADFGSKKDITHIDIIRELLISNGNRRDATRGLGIADTAVSWHAKNIRRLPDADLQKYANELKTTVDEIKRVCGDFDSRKGITHIEVIRALLAVNGNRKIAGRNLGIAGNAVTRRAKDIIQLPDAELQKYADKLSRELRTRVTICDILNAVAPRKAGKINSERRVQIIRELLASDGKRTTAAQRLGIHPTAVTEHAKNIRRLPDAQLQRYADQLNTTADEIKRVCADFDPQKGVTHIEVIRALFASKGNRKIAAQSLLINSSAINQHIQNIRGLTDTRLQIYASRLNATVGEIRRVCAEFDSRKTATHIEVIRELLKTNGNRTAAAQSLGITNNNVGHRAQKIMRLSETELVKFAVELGVSVEQIKDVCAPRLEQAKKLFEK